MLIGAINALSGGLHMYFLMSELTGGTSKFIMTVSSLIRKYICTYVDQRIDGTNQHSHNARHFSRFELRMVETSPETNYLQVSKLP
jgi:hypothetical protein